MLYIDDFINKYGREVLEVALGLFSGILLYKNRKHKIDISGYPGVIDAQNKVISSLIIELDKYKDRSGKQEEEITRLTRNEMLLVAKIENLEKELTKEYYCIDAFKDFAEHIPTPVWMKYPNNTIGKYSTMCFINQRYETEWGISKVSYEEKEDNLIWPKEIADKFAEHDYQVTTKCANIITYEDVPTYPFRKIDELNKVNSWVIWKFPVIVKKEIAGVGGMAIRIKQNDE